MGILQARILEGVPMPSSRESYQPRDWTQVSLIAGNSLPSEPPGKTVNIGVGSLSLLQRIIPTQESNWGLLHCRRILYQLSYQGSPIFTIKAAYSLAHKDMLLVGISLKVIVSALISTYIQISPLRAINDSMIVCLFPIQIKVLAGLRPWLHYTFQSAS